jgi:hypothetical protein
MSDYDESPEQQPAARKRQEFKLDDYIDVAERIQLFYERFPEGSLQGAPVNPAEYGFPPGGSVLVYRAVAKRSPEDSIPGIGWASEPVPGKTPYTRDSELMNAETSAWGRAIAALGIGTNRGIASRQEVRNRQAAEGPSKASPAARKYLGDLIGKAQAEVPPPDGGEWFDFFQRRTPIADLSKDQCSAAIELFKQRPDDLAQALDALLSPSEADDIPF